MRKGRKSKGKVAVGQGRSKGGRRVRVKEIERKAGEED